MSEWHPIETAPKDGTKIDVWISSGADQWRITDVYWSDIQESFCVDGQYGPSEPSPLSVFPRSTHWMMPPEPPAAGGAGKRRIVGQKLLTHDEAAAAMGVSSSSLDRLLILGKAPPFVSIGVGTKRVSRRYPEEMLNTYLVDRLSTPPLDAGTENRHNPQN